MLVNFSFCKCVSLPEACAMSKEFDDFFGYKSNIGGKKLLFNPNLGGRKLLSNSYLGGMKLLFNPYLGGRKLLFNHHCFLIVHFRWFIMCFNKVLYLILFTHTRL